MTLIDDPKSVMVAASTPVTGPYEPKPDWFKSYRQRVIQLDLLALTLGFGVSGAAFGMTLVTILSSTGALTGTALILHLSRAYERRFVGIGGEEYARIVRTGVTVLAGLGLLSSIVESFTPALWAVPGSLLMVMLIHISARARLHAARASGENTSTIVLAGHLEQVLNVLKPLDASTHHGVKVVGVCLAPVNRRLDDATYRDHKELLDLGIPVLGRLDEISSVARRISVDAVGVLPSRELGGEDLRTLGWELEKDKTELLIFPAITEARGPRVNLRPICGLPVVHLDRPEHTGLRLGVKSAFDRVFALVFLLMFAPLMLLIGLLVRLESPGRAVFRQTRVGRRGKTFTMLKFRSMRDDAIYITSDMSAGNDVLFKMKADPRVTRLGKFLRSWSLDELPQMINVLMGQMSLVGPRPALLSEVEKYEFDARRRLLVKPGLTGLWQINGRSDLSWRQSVDLDLRYEENWSFTFDFIILYKTLRAVLRRTGAY